MRNVVAVIFVALLVATALSIATSLQWYRRGHAKLRQKLRGRGQLIIAEIPTKDGLEFFTEDPEKFHWADHQILKDRIRAVRVLINGAPISVSISHRFQDANLRQPITPTDRPLGLERDRWDVEIDMPSHIIMVECGTIRERVSQELAQHIFKAVKDAIESQDSD